MIRPLRINDYDEARVKQILPYKLGPMAAKTAGMRAGMSVPVKAAGDYEDFDPRQLDPAVMKRLTDQFGETAVKRMNTEELYMGGANEEELAKGLAAMGGYITSLKEIEDRIATMRPVFDALEISDETLIRQLIDGMPQQISLRKSEAEAVVRGTVDQFEFSKDFYQPEFKPTGSMKGDDILEEALRNNPNVNAQFMYNTLKAQGYAVGGYDKFIAHFKRVKSSIYRID